MTLRRRTVLSTVPVHALAAGWIGSGVLPMPVRAGAQREEDLSDSLRTALSASLTDAPPPVPGAGWPPAALAPFEQWRLRLEPRLRAVMGQAQERADFLATVWYEATRAGLAPSLVLGLIQVESGFRKYAISPAGARGYMQVMPFWVRAIGDGREEALFHLQTNLRYGCVILQHYLQREDGDLTLALGRYNGTRGQTAYPSAVLAAERHWQP